MMISLFLSLAAAPFSHAGDSSLVCRTPDNAFVITASSYEPLRLYRNQVLQTAPFELTDESNHDENENVQGCEHRSSCEVKHTDHYQAILVLDGKRLPVNCENTSAMALEQGGEQDLPDGF